MLAETEDMQATQKKIEKIVWLQTKRDLKDRFKILENNLVKVI